MLCSKLQGKCIKNNKPPSIQRQIIIGSGKTKTRALSKRVPPQGPPDTKLCKIILLPGAYSKKIK
jgi:hypothetical protein